MIKFLQVGDLHVGRGRASWGDETALSRAQNLLTVIREVAQEQKCQGILVTGDIFDVKSVSHKERELVTREFLLMAEEGLDVYVIPGNHDLLTSTTSNTDFLAEVARSRPSRLKVAFASAAECWKVPTKGPPLSILGVPVSMSENQSWVEDYCSKLPKGEDFIFMGHGMVGGVVLNDRGFQLPDAEAAKCLSLNKACKDNPNVIWWGYGDIHKRQPIPGIPEHLGAYAGTQAQMNFGESQDRGALVLSFDVDEDSGRWVMVKQKYVRTDNRGFDPLITVTDESEVKGLPANAMLRLAPGLVLSKALRDRVLKTMKVVDDRSTPPPKDSVEGEEQVVIDHSITPFDPLLADLREVEAHVLSGLDVDDKKLLAEAKSVVANAVDRFRSRTYV